MESLYETWLNRIDSYYESQYKEPVIEYLCQYGGGSTDGRMARGKVFNAGYEVFIVLSSLVCTMESASLFLVKS